MKKLKNYFKLIFAAMMCFVMKLMPDGKSRKKSALNNGCGVPELENRVLKAGNAYTEMKKCGYTVDACGKNLCGIRYGVENSLSRKRVYWHPPHRENIISGEAYWNTG